MQPLAAGIAPSAAPERAHAAPPRARSAWLLSYHGALCTIRRLPTATSRSWCGALALVVAACSSSAKPKLGTPHLLYGAVVDWDDPPCAKRDTPPHGGHEAVQALLAAEQRGDQAVSYRLLSAAGRKRYPHLADWQERRSQLPPITSFTISSKSGSEGGDGSANVVAEVRHKPGLDPFVGLSAGRERETWTAHREGSRLVGRPAIPRWPTSCPPSQRAAAAALQWARAVQACDKPAAMALQAVDELYGTSDRDGPRSAVPRGTVTVGKVGRLQAGPSSADLIAQYCTDAPVLGPCRSRQCPNGPLHGGRWLPSDSVEDCRPQRLTTEQFRRPVIRKPAHLRTNCSMPRIEA